MKTFEEITKKSYDFNLLSYKLDWRWQLLAELYDKNFVKVQDKTEQKMPKKLHQIWLGSTIPDEYKKWGDTWQQFNPDWEYKLWTDVNTGDVEIPHRDLFESVKNYGQKSDILRLHILDQFGGIYVDTDFECLKSFDDLSYLNFLVSVGYPSKVELYNGLIGCIPNHPIISRVLQELDLRMVLSSKGSKEIFDTTGGYFFTRCFFEIVKKYTEGVVAFPIDYFFPFPNEKDFHLKVKNAKDYIQDCSYALHYWACSWMPNLKEKRYGLDSRR